MERDFALSQSKEHWLFYVSMNENMTEEEAKLEWYKHHELGKYVICEARDDETSRLFIRNVSNRYEDLQKKDGWWNIFTVTDRKKPCKKGLWICKAEEFSIDKNGFLKMRVTPVKSVNDVVIREMLAANEGTWDSPAWWFIAGTTNAFFKEYNFHLGYQGIHTPNIDFLAQIHPELVQDDITIAKATLEAYLHNRITLEEIERCLNTPNDWEAMVLDIVACWKAGNLATSYGAKYPLFVKKIDLAIMGESDYTANETVVNYIQRQLTVYHTLVEDNAIQESDGDTLDKIECVLQYREEAKKAEKAAKKAARKAAKKS